MLTESEILHEIMREIEYLDHLVSRNDKEINLKRIKKSTQSIKYIYSRFRLIDKISHNKYQPQIFNCDVKNILIDSLSQMQQIYFNCSLNVTTQLEDNLFLDTDPLLLKLVFSNIIENAFKHGGSRLEILLSKVDGNIRCEFKNDIPQDIINKGFSNQEGLIILGKISTLIGAVFDKTSSEKLWNVSVILPLNNT